MPPIQLYHIRLVAWSDSRRILFGQKDMNGITGGMPTFVKVLRILILHTIDFNSRIFGPRSSVIQGLTETAKKQAIKEAENLFA
jgi:hypothetical protein